MSVDGSPSRLLGVSYGRRERFEDDRGSFMEVWRESAFGELSPGMTGLAGARFVQANLSESAAGVLRGLHYHRHQLDYWAVVDGRAFVGLVDVRPVIEDLGARAVVETREIAAGDTVTIPAGVAHGFLALEPLKLLYLVTNEYDGSDELGFAWDDPAVAVPWPAVVATADGRPILSERDRTNPSLAELVRKLRDRG
jgi:dTDP-4-dehydrorhamnose 3,5-epimerase